jgi:hypothetical protein
MMAVPVQGEETAAPPATLEGGQSLSDLNQKLTNPVSDIWSLSFQQNNYVLTIPGRGSGHWSSNLQFQPVMPIGLTGNWNLITRPVFQLFNTTPYPYSSSYPTPHTDIRTSTAFGDTIWMEMFSPSSKLAGNWLLGIGPTFIFPTASELPNGQGKWQAGPAVVVGYLSKKWILGAFVQNWTSFAGQSNRDDTNQMNLQPIAAYFLPDGWSIGYSGNILANWKAKNCGDVWTVPIGIAVNKVVKLGNLPVKIGVAGQYMPVQPSSFGQKWNIQVSITPVLPKLVKGNLFGE